MKNLVSLLLLAVFVTSCNSDAKKTDGYVINGSAEGIYNGMRVYLNAADERGQQTPQDTAVVMDGKFKFEGKVDHPKMWFLSVNNVNGALPIMVENGTIDVTFNKDDVSKSKISGTKSNTALTEYAHGFKAMMDKRTELNDAYRTQINSADSITRQKTAETLGNLNEEMKEYPYTFLKSHTDDYFSLSLIENILKSNPEDLTPVESAFTSMDADIKNSEYGMLVKSQLDAVKSKNEGLAMLNVGNKAPDFSAPDPDGKQVSLSSIKGKATIIDFWASWCKPCRMENPNVVNVYKKYHDKGLEIISVSLDRPGQKEMWLKAIEEDQLTWHHVSNLQYFSEPVAQQYNIEAIPATYILDGDGVIVAKSLRGQALEDKIAEMLN